MARAAETEKIPEIRESVKLARPLLNMGQSRGAPAAGKRKDETMSQDTSTTNLFQRRDTMFGICEAVGQDFGFNPTWLRLAFIAPLFFFPVQTFAAYFGLGAVVLASRLIFPAKKAAAQPALTAVEGSRPVEATEELALAA